MHQSNIDSDYVRPNDNQGALLNTNNSALDQYRKTKKRFAKLNTIEDLDNRLSSVENLLHQILEKLNK